MVPFAIMKPDGEQSFAVEVMDPGAAANIVDELDVTHDRFEPHKTGMLQVKLYFN